MQFQSPLIQRFTGLTLGILTGIGMSQTVLAQTTLPNDVQQEIEEIQRETEENRQEVERGQWEAEQQQREAQTRQQYAKELQRLAQEWSDLLDSPDNFTQAEVAFRKLSEMRPGAREYYQLGNSLYQQGKVEAAVILHQQAIRLNPRHALAHNAIGVARANQGRWEEAIAEYEQALLINDNYTEALKNIGRALLQQGRREEAIAYLEKARNLFKEQNIQDEVARVERLLQQAR